MKLLKPPLLTLVNFGFSVDKVAIDLSHWVMQLIVAGCARSHQLELLLFGQVVFHYMITLLDIIISGLIVKLFRVSEILIEWSLLFHGWLWQIETSIIIKNVRVTTRPILNVIDPSTCWSSSRTSRRVTRRII